ncbi:MAG: hypothetical protein S4CHLAM6_09540 [Chlamydiae bacterium]|nr:hypothetical protein [Chlamydiota bacterium]
MMEIQNSAVDQFFEDWGDQGDIDPNNCEIETHEEVVHTAMTFQDSDGRVCTRPVAITYTSVIARPLPKDSNENIANQRERERDFTDNDNFYTDENNGPRPYKNCPPYDPFKKFIDDALAKEPETSGSNQRIASLVKKYLDPNYFIAYPKLNELSNEEIQNYLREQGVFSKLSNENVLLEVSETASLPAKFSVESNPIVQERIEMLKQACLFCPMSNSKQSVADSNDILFNLKARNIGSKIAHDFYDFFHEFKLGYVNECEKLRAFLSKILPRGAFEALDGLTVERQLKFAAAAHEGIDLFFKTNQSINYLPESKDRLALGIMPAPYELIGALKIPPTLVNSVKGWRVGLPFNNRTIAGNRPTWSTVRQRHWKNKAYLHENGLMKEAQIYKATPENIARMKKGLAPQVFDPKKNTMQSIELHHIPARRDGGHFNFTEVTPREHALQDPFRHIGK